MADSRKPEPVKNNPGIYRRHANGCKRGKSCGCPYLVRWKAGGRDHKRFFPTLELAREFKGVSPRSIKHAKIALGIMWACALEDGAVASNPVQQTRYIPSPEAQRAHAKPEAKRLTATDVLAILNAMPEAWRAFFSLLAHSGVRVGELLGLTWANVHLGDDPHLSIVEQVYRGERTGPKWGSVGKVPLSPGMAAWL